jgi:RHS repeat-associated protein
VVLSGTSGTASFKYDPFGRRIQKILATGTINYLYDGPNSVEEIDSVGTSLALYAQGAGIDAPLSELRNATTAYYNQDGLGSVTSSAGGTGQLLSSATYDSFGNLMASTGSFGNSFQYTGRENDSNTDLRYYRARFYSPSTGRFLSEDLLGFSGGRNFYSYVGNNPTTLVDPVGLKSQGRQIPGSETPFTNPNIHHYNCLAWGLGINQFWIQPSDPNDSPNVVFPVFGCAKIPCSKPNDCKKKVKVAVFEDSGDPGNWHVERQTCDGTWTSKNGQSFLYDKIPDPDAFYKEHYPPKGPVHKTCWSCPATPPFVMPQDPKVVIAP